MFPSVVPSFSRSQLRLALSLSFSLPRGGRGHGGRVCVFRHGCFRVQQLFPCSTAALQINRRRRGSAAFFCSALCLQYKKDQRVEQQRFTFFDCKVFFFRLVCCRRVFCFGIFLGHSLFFLLLFVLFVCLRQQRGYICFFLLLVCSISSSHSFFFFVFGAVFRGLEKAHYCVLDGKIMYVGV